MFVKKFKRQCSVRGCKNVEDVFLISKRREMGNTVGMCRSCLTEALKSLDNYREPEKVIKREDKPLFPHPELKVTLSSVADIEEPKPQEVIEEVAEDIPIVTEDTVTPIAEDKPAEAPKTRATTNTKAKKKPKKK